MNKKHKGFRKDARGMEFENYSKRINSVQEIETFGQLTQDKQKQNRFSIKSNEIVLKEIEKSKFAQINDVRYYFNDGIVSLSFSHPLLLKIIDYKKTKNKGLNHICRLKNTTFSRWKKLCSKKML